MPDAARVALAQLLALVARALVGLRRPGRGLALRLDPVSRIACTAAPSLASGTGFAAERGKVIMAQSRIEMVSMTVPARLTKSHERSRIVWKMLSGFGTRYGGSSSTSGGGGDLSIVCLRIHATTIATAMPSMYIESISSAPTERKPKSFLSVKNAAIISV